MRYMLDTNICIHLIQKRPLPLVQRLSAMPFGDVVLSAIVQAELQHGVERDPAVRTQAQHALTALLAFFPVIPFGEDAARSYGVLRAALPDRRRDALDRLIAAHAVALGLTLVTNSLSDFEGYPGLRIENWVAPEATSG